MPKKKSFAEELAELANPAPAREHDPEADIFGSGPALEASDDELVELTHSRGKGGARLLGDLPIPGKEYTGRKSSRAAVFGGSSDEELEESEEEGSGDDDSHLQNGNGNLSEEESDKGSEQEGDEDEEASGSDEEEEEEESDEETAAANGHAGREITEADALEREYRELQQQETEAMAGVQERAAKERLKAVAVRAQRRVWDAGLELRIMLQRALQSGNRLPQPESHRVAVAIDPEAASGLGGLAADAAGVLEELLGLLGALEEQNPAVGEAARILGVKRKALEVPEDAPASERLWARMDDAHAWFVPFRDAAIDRWHRKTVLATGSAARGLKALNQSVSSQVCVLMQDAERVVKRTRVPKRQCVPLCATEADLAREGGDSESEDQEAIQQDEERDPETYDDGEFYQTLLKEFLDGKQDGGANWYTGPKQRKLVDRRASKGRKLRYHIHEKLANFMAPVELETPQFASNIFANLFGGAGKK